MRKVTTVNLNGNAYQLEEAAYDRLREYLESAETKLRANPDRAEILADLEQSIADKCDTCLGAHKNVVSEREVEQILREMGPVDGVATEETGAAAAGSGAAGPQADAASASQTPPASDGGPRRKRIYRLPSEGMLGGVCAGWAAYLNIDVVWIRLAFVVLTFATGVWFFVWLAMLCVMPAADSPEEIAAAHGEPLNAREVIERAKKKAADGASAPRGGEQWKRFGDDLKRTSGTMAAGFADAGENVREYSHRLRERARRRKAYRFRHDRPVSPGARIVAGVSLPFLSILSAVLFVAFILTLISLVTGGAFFGVLPFPPMPLWVAILLTCVIYGAVGGPIGVARKQAQSAVSGATRGWSGVGDGVLWTLVVVALFWLAWHYAPVLREWVQGLPTAWAAPGGWST